MSETRRRPDLDDFRACLRQEFRMRLGPDDVLALELLEVEDTGGRQGPAGFVSSFSLIFRSPGEARHAPQSTYRLENAKLGALDVFLVPIGPREGGMCYQAVFN
jgi:hypothetical protein